MAKHNKVGNNGEQEAVNYLLSKAYNILARNFRFSRFEIDIIAKDGDVLVFIEVKTRTNVSLGMPEVFLSQAQQERIMIAAEHFLAQNNFEGDVRFDIISIIPGKDLHHIKDAFN